MLLDLYALTSLGTSHAPGWDQAAVDAADDATLKSWMVAASVHVRYEYA